MFDRSHIEEVHARHCELVADPAIRLSKEQISELVSAVYFASIRLEEGEKVLPRVFAAQSEELLYLSPVPIYRFASPQLLSVEWLRKFALAVDQERSVFVVVFREGITSVLGVAHEQWKASAENHVRRGDASVLVAATDVGVVSIVLSGTRIGAYRDGQFHRTTLNIFKDRNFNSIAARMLARWALPFERQQTMLDELEVLIRTAAKLKRGGTIVVMNQATGPDSDTLMESGTFGAWEHMKNGLGSVSLGYKQGALGDFRRENSTSQVDPDRRRHLQFVAQLSAIDGALVVDERFEPRVIGAKLKAPAYLGNLHMAGDSRIVQNKSTQPVGTRHTSALNYVAARGDGMVFVISSDGPVSAFVPVDGAIATWRNVLGQ